MDFTQFRKATPDDIPALRELIELSARQLGASEYSDAQIEGALAGAWGVDATLIEDGTYFLLEEEGSLIACGGWSFRKTPFGANDQAPRDDSMLDPFEDRARIRAFFVHPAWARKGISTQLLKICELEAMDYGFSSFELVATLPGVPFYASAGYEADEPFEHPLPGGLSIAFVPMRKG